MAAANCHGKTTSRNGRTMPARGLRTPHGEVLLKSRRVPPGLSAHPTPRSHAAGAPLPQADGEAGAEIAPRALHGRVALRLEDELHRVGVAVLVLVALPGRRGLALRRRRERTGYAAGPERRTRHLQLGSQLPRTAKGTHPVSKALPAVRSSGWPETKLRFGVNPAASLSAIDFGSGGRLHTASTTKRERCHAGLYRARLVRGLAPCCGRHEAPGTLRFLQRLDEHLEFVG